MTSELSADPLIRYKQLRDDFWLFCTHCVYTLDEVDQANPVKPYPTHFLYLRFVAIMLTKHLKIAIPKSRRMTVSWTILSYIVWRTIFRKGQRWAVLSKKENDALELVQRCEFIINHIPPTILSPDLIPKMKHGKMQSSPPAIEFEETLSKIEGFPSGANQLRQRGFSGIFEDETAFQAEAEESYAASEPTIRGGGQFIKVSSRAVEDKGFFKKIVFDRLDATDTRFPEVPPAPTKEAMEGVTTWKNPRNDFFVIDLHYTANPAKRGIEFRETLRKTLPARKFRMEYEKDWETFEGKPVYEDFVDTLHLTHRNPGFQVGLPLLIGWDSSGLTPAAILAQLQEEQLVIFKEIIGPGMGAVRFIPHVIDIIGAEFPQVSDIEKQTVSFFDPAGFKKNEITEQTYVQTMMSHGFRQIKPGPMTWNKRVDAVTARLVGIVRGKPKILIYEPGCPTLVAGFRGGYRYSDQISNNEPTKPQAVKDAHSHPHDGLQYLCGGLESYRRDGNYESIPVPNYSFQGETHQTGVTLRREYGRNVR